MRRSLIHFWRMNMAVAAGVAVTTSVLTGALMVGDSLRGSLKALTEDRLGRIDHALLNPRLFPTDLVERLGRQSALGAVDIELVPLLVLGGSVVQPDSGKRATGAQILGIDPRFPDLYAAGPWTESLALDRAADQIFPSVVLNRSLAEELGAEVGDDVLVSVGRASAVPTATLMGRREQRDILSTLRLTVTAVISADGPGRFGLESRQTRPLNAYVDLTLLQGRIDRRGEANALLIAKSTEAAEVVPSERLDDLLRSALTVADLGLELKPAASYVAVESEAMILRTATETAVLRFANEIGATAWPYLTYLANRLEIGDRLLPYSTVTALATPIPPSIGTLVTRTGVPVDRLGDGQIALNTWAAEDLAAELGSEVELSYYLIGANDELYTATSRFEVASIVEMRSVADDPALTPAVPGVSDAQDMAGWDPPFPVDLELVRPADEDYWDRYRGTPKAFIELGTGQGLWQSRYGRLTGIRLAPVPGSTVAELHQTLEAELPRVLSTEAAGFQWIPVRAQGLEGASGTTDFAGLFLGFSLFLIVSAALLVALLFSLLVESRASEAGLLLATGYPKAAVRRRFLLEGGVLGLLGVIGGTALAYGYTYLVLLGLTSWWSPVLDSPMLKVHLELSTLLVGGLSTLTLVLLVIAWTIRRLSRAPARRLLSGQVSRATDAGRGQVPRRIALSSLLLAVLLIATSMLTGAQSAPGLFFGVGAALLVCGVSAYAAWARTSRASETLQPRLTVVSLASRNSSRNLGRSLLSVTLVASASFVLVSVSANRKTHASDKANPYSGSGGFSVVAEADIPLAAELDKVLQPLPGPFFSFRRLPGDDASCLNLYQPESPRVLGVVDSFIERGGFRFHSTLEKVDNPWTLLQLPLEEGVVATIGDYNSVRWILHSGLGQEIVVLGDHGEPVRLRIVALLSTSIFQSELLISEEMFLRHFSDHEGYAFFLGDSGSAATESVIENLERRLSVYGLDAQSALTRLQSYQAVENMYLTTFEVLGGLGLLLGTLGLGVVLLRNTIERRGELAVLRSFGFRRSVLARMVVAENVFLLSIGLSVGSIAGLIAVAPHIVTGGVDVPWTSLAAMLLAVFATGLVASAAAVRTSLRIPLLPALKAE